MGPALALRVNRRGYTQELEELKFMCSTCTCSIDYHKVICASVNFTSTNGQLLSRIFVNSLPFHYSVHTLELYGSISFPGEFFRCFNLCKDIT